MSNVSANNQSDLDRRAEEQKVLLHVTEDLIKAGGSSQRDADYFEALDRNKFLWSALRQDVMSRANRLPQDLREQIDQLGRWVEEQTARVLRGESEINSLIVVNRNVIDGLA